MISKNTFLTVFAISIALIFLMAPIGAASHSINPAVATSTNYQPDPTLNTNATWATFYHGWNATEYNNGTANTTLNAGVSTIYKNPIAVNPTDIEAYGLLQNDNLSKAPKWNNTSNWVNSGGSVLSTGTLGKGTTLNIEDTLANTNATCTQTMFTIGETKYPSSSPGYDYITTAYTLTGPSLTGAEAYLNIWNSTQDGMEFKGGDGITPGQTIYISEPLTDIGVGFNTTPGAGYSNSMKLDYQIHTPKGAAAGDSWNLTISALAFTDYQIPLGTNSTGSPVVDAINPTLAHFGSNNLKYTKVLNGGYSVALSASPDNLSQVQTPITSGNYIEQVQYSGSFQLPSAPDLSYTTANITFPLTVPADQIQVLTLGGTSYTTTLGNRTNGTVQLVSGMPATGATAYYAIVDYTASQWQSISHPAGFFTYDGIAYYYWLAIGAIASLLALGVGVRHAQTKREQTEKVDRITRRGR